MNIIAVRHTSVNVAKGTCYGQSNVAMAHSFETEKDQLVQKLSMEDFQRVYSSPLNRCKKLAESISKGIPVNYDSRLMELDFGKWEGLSWDEIGLTEEAKTWFNYWVSKPCPDGESYLQLISRVQDFLKQIIPRNENVLIVTHAGVIRALISLLSGIGPRKAFETKIDYGSLIKWNTHE